MRVFWAHGYDGASLAMLQDATGLTPPSIYNAFGSKAGLYRACLDHYNDHIGAHTNAALGESPAGRSGLEKFLVAAARQFTDAIHPAGCMVSTAALDLAPQSEAVAREAASRRSATLGVLADYLRNAQAAGALDPAADPAVLARFFGAVVQGMSVQARDGATETDLLGIVRTALTAWRR